MSQNENRAKVVVNAIVAHSKDSESGQTEISLGIDCWDSDSCPWDYECRLIRGGRSATTKAACCISLSVDTQKTSAA